MNVPHVIGTNLGQRQKSIIAFNSLKFDKLQSYKALCFNFIFFYEFCQATFPAPRTRITSHVRSSRDFSRLSQMESLLKSYDILGLRNVCRSEYTPFPLFSTKYLQCFPRSVANEPWALLGHLLALDCGGDVGVPGCTRHLGA